MKTFIALILVSSFTLKAQAVQGILQNYVSEAEMFEISNHGPRQVQMQGTALRLDTRDRDRCQKLKALIKRTNAKASAVGLTELCKVDRENPYKDIVVLQTVENEELLNYIKTGLTLGISAYDTNKAPKNKQLETEDNNHNSKKELLISPLFAAVVSESITHLRTYVKENRGKALNSYFLGSTILVVTNPAETVADVVNGFAEYRFIQDAKTKVLLRDYRDEDTFGRQGGSPQLNALEFKLEFRFY